MWFLVYRKAAVFMILEVCNRSVDLVAYLLSVLAAACGFHPLSRVSHAICSSVALTDFVESSRRYYKQDVT